MVDLKSFISLQKQNVQDMRHMITDKDLNDKRTKIQSQLDNLNTAYDDANKTTSDILTKQKKVASIVKNEKEQLEKEKAQLENEIIGKERTIMLNDSARMRKQEYNKILLVNILALCIVFISVVLSNNFPFIPQFIFTIVSIIAISLALIYSFKQYIYIQSRTKADFNELQKADPYLKDKDVTTRDLASGEFDFGSISCIGSSCCDKTIMKYDPELNRCVYTPKTTTPKTTTPKTTETFVPQYLGVGTHAQEVYGKA